MFPEAFNGIEKRAVLGQPDDQEAGFVQAQGCLRGFAVVVGGVVQHQNQMLTRVRFQHVLQEGDKAVAVFVGSGQVSDAPAVPVVRAKDVQILRSLPGSFANLDVAIAPEPNREESLESSSAHSEKAVRPSRH